MIRVFINCHSILQSLMDTFDALHFSLKSTTSSENGETYWIESQDSIVQIELPKKVVWNKECLTQVRILSTGSDLKFENKAERQHSPDFNPQKLRINYIVIGKNKNWIIGSAGGLKCAIKNNGLQSTLAIRSKFSIELRKSAGLEAR